MTTFAPGTRYSNSEIYDEATAEVVHGWQVFVQKRADGTPTGRRSFVDPNGNLCSIDLAAAMRAQAISQAAPELLDALAKTEAVMSQFQEKPGAAADIIRNGYFGHALVRARRALTCRGASSMLMPASQVAQEVDVQRDNLAHERPHTAG